MSELDRSVLFPSIETQLRVRRVPVDELVLGRNAIRYRQEEARMIYGHPGCEVRCIGHRVVRGKNHYRWQAFKSALWAL